MNNSETPYQEYCKIHSQFIDEYKLFSHRISELYSHPKKFIEENAAEMDRFMAESSVPGTPSTPAGSVHGIREFVYRMEDFKLQIMTVFFEHRNLIEKSTAYMLQIKELKQMPQSSKTEQQFVDLIPELSSLRFTLKYIEENANGIMAHLKNVQTKWENINANVAA